jgi:pimeloyl-ACP methyl ester carboxylesterase
MADAASAPIELPARDEGHGPDVLLLHGIGGSHANWGFVVPLLATNHRVLVPDLRGHGKAPGPEGSLYTFEELEGDVLKLLDDREVSSAHVVGESGGALLALRLALDHPERVRSLTLVSGMAYTDAHTRAIAERWEETYQREGPDAFALRVLKDVYYPDWIEAHLDYADQLRAVAPRLNLAPAMQWTHAMAQFDERRRIGTIRCPTLIIQAMDDQVVDASHGRILRQSIPGSQIRILAQTGHMVPVERPAETAEAISKFIGSLGADAPASPSE